MRAWPDPGLSQEAHLLLGEFRDILGWPKSSFGFFHTCRPARIPCVRGFYKGQIQKVKVILDPILLCLIFFLYRIKPVNPKGNQLWIFIGKTDAEAEAPILWSPDAKSWLIGNDPDAGKDWGQEEKEMIEDEMVGWHHWLNGHEFEQALGDGKGQGSLVCCSSWGGKESDMT